jgi:hypothetical protein
MQGGVALDTLMHEGEDGLARGGLSCAQGETHRGQRGSDHAMEGPSHAFLYKRQDGARFLVS